MPQSIGPLRDEIDFMMGRCKVKKLSMSISDVAGGFTALLKYSRGWTHTYLTETLASSAATMTVEDTSLFGATGTIFVGQEAMTYSGKTATTFTGLSRAYLGTLDGEHFSNPDSEIPITPIVTAGAHTIVGRRATLYSAEIDEVTNTPNATDVVYRGRISGGVKAGKAKWDISLEHRIAAFFEGSAGQGMESIPLLQGAYYSGDTFEGSWSTTELLWLKNATSDYKTAWTNIDNGFYVPADLISEWNAKTNTAFNAISPAPSSDPPRMYQYEGKVTLKLPSVSNEQTRVIVNEHSVLWYLGFDPGSYEGTPGIVKEYESQNDIKQLFVDWSQHWYRRNTNIPQVAAEDATPMTALLYAQVPGNFHAKINQITNGTYSDRVLFDIDIIEEFHHNSDNFWFVDEKSEDRVLRHIIPIGPYESGDAGDLKDTLIRLTTGGSRSEPPRWRSQGMSSNDIDFDEMTSALGTTPSKLIGTYGAVVEPTEPYKHIGHQLAMLGICPRITDGSKMGFTKISTPVTTNALSIEVDDNVWELADAADVVAKFGNVATLNSVTLKHTFDYRGGEGADDQDNEGWGPDHKFSFREGNKLLGRTQSVTYECPALWIIEETGEGVNEVVSLINGQLLSSHFTLLAQESAVIEVPCTWRARQFKCGDLIKLTHPLAPDTVEADIGMEERLGIVVGRKHILSGRGGDTLMVRIGPDVNAGGIAPCSRGSSYVAGTKTVTCSSAHLSEYALTGTNDLAAFTAVAGVQVAVDFIERDSTSPDTWSGVVASGGITTSEVVLTTDVFSTGFPATGVWMIPRDWVNAWTTHKDYSYNADAATLPTLGSGSDEAKVWVI
jgi:hypothetical protein